MAKAMYAWTATTLLRLQAALTCPPLLVVGVYLFLGHLPQHGLREYPAFSQGKTKVRRCHPMNPAYEGGNSYRLGSRGALPRLTDFNTIRCEFNVL